MGKSRAAERAPYRDTLAAIGRYFDQQLYRSIFVAEIDDGYIGKARPAEEAAELHSEGFTFPHDDIQALIVSATVTDELPLNPPPLLPTGYSDFMRAVGEMCDQSAVKYVSLAEATNGFVVGFTKQAKTGRGYERRRFLLDRRAIDDLLNQSSQ